MSARPRVNNDKTTYRGRFAEHLRNLREKSGKTADEVANGLGEQSVTLATIYHWESGRRTPSVVQLYALSQVLGLKSVSDILPPK